MTYANDLKKAAALEAVKAVKDGMVIGLGTGSTAAFAIEALGEQVKQGLKIVAVPTSNKSADMAKGFGIQLVDLEMHPVIDVTIDGADEVERDSLNMIKGRGGALLREKIVALASRQVVIVVDDSKITAKLGTKAPLPVEIVPFGWKTTVQRLIELIPGQSADSIVLRRAQDGQPFISDEENYILDCHLGTINDAPHMEALISNVIGVVGTGLFINIASQVIVAAPDGVRCLSNS
jgi:ribose 5-phosphate isomerase A